MNQTTGFRASIPDPGMVGLYDLWDRLRRELGRLPLRQEIGPLDLPPEALPTMMILEREPSGRIRCRLAGTMMREIYKFEAKGWYLDEVLPSGATAVRVGIYERVLREECAALCRMRLAIPGREFIATDRIYVPALGDAPDRPTVILSVQRFLYAADVVGEPDADGVYELRFDEPMDD